MRKDRFSRRALLKSMGVSGAMLPLLFSEKARGATPTGGVRRFFAMVYGNGARPNFYPTGNDFSAPFGKSIAPLEPFKSKMIMPIGLDYKNILDDGYQYDGHFTYCATLTGTREKKSESRKATGPSIDQMIADKLSGAGITTKTPLLTLGIRSTGDGCSVSWRSAGVQNAAQQQAQPVFNQLFSTVTMPPAQVDMLMKRRKSVLDFVGTELMSFGKRLGSEDRMKVEQHLVSIRDLENRLQGSGGGQAGAGCGKPTISAGDVAGNGKAMFDIVAMAFKCDLTRVATITISDDGGGDGTSFPWVGSSGDFHGVAHASNDAQMTAISNWFFTLYAGLAQQLDQAPEPGGTALDNSVLTSWSNMNEGADHFNGKIPITMVGSLGGFLKTNQVLRLPKEPHNKLLTTILHGMGMTEVPGVGATQYAGTFPQMIK
jgi:hypothetical protein